MDRYTSTFAKILCLVVLRATPMAIEVPEETLPYPFNWTNHFSEWTESCQRCFSKQVSNLQTAAYTLSVSSNLPATLIKTIPSEKEEFSSKDTGSTQVTPAKLVSTPLELMSNTTAQKPQKRSIMSPDEDSVRSITKLARRPRTPRSMEFDTPLKNSMLDVLLENLDESIRDQIREKEKKALVEKDPAISQAKWRQQMIASLPKLFDMLLFYSQSTNRSVFTKQEIVHRIFLSHLENVKRREVDEQLKLLQELIPEFYQEKMESGHIYIWVNELSCPDLMRTRLNGAT